MSASGGGESSQTSYTAPLFGKKQATNILRDAKNSLGQSFIDPNNMTAGFDPAQLQAQQQALMAAQGQQGIAAQQVGLFGDLARTGTNSDPALQQMLDSQRQMAMQDMQAQASDIRGGAAGAGQVGSSRHGVAEGLMRSRGLQNLQAQQANTLSNAYNQGINTRMNAMANAGNVMAGQLTPAQTLGAVGAQRQALEQRRLDDALRYQQSEQSRLGTWTNVLGSTISPWSVTQQAGSSGGEGGKGALIGALVGGGLGAMAGNPMAGAGIGSNIGGMI